MKMYCKSRHPIQPDTGRCSVGHMPKAMNMWEVKDERIGFLDIETSDLNADFGFMISWFIKPLGRKAVGDMITQKDLRKHDMCDERILETLCKELKKYDVVVTYYGTGFDIKFIRTRCLEQGIAFPFYGELVHWDLYYVCRDKFKLSHNRLDNLARLLGVKGKDHVDPKLWRQAVFGNQKALGYIWNHNRKDVEVLENCYSKLDGYWRKTARKA